MMQVALIASPAVVMATFPLTASSFQAPSLIGTLLINRRAKTRTVKKAPLYYLASAGEKKNRAAPFIGQ